MGGVISFSCDLLYLFVCMVKVNMTFIIVQTKKNDFALILGSVNVPVAQTLNARTKYSVKS